MILKNIHNHKFQSHNKQINKGILQNRFINEMLYNYSTSCQNNDTNNALKVFQNTAILNQV